MGLSAEQLAQFEEQGFVILRQILPCTVISDAKAAASELVDGLAEELAHKVACARL